MRGRGKGQDIEFDLYGIIQMCVKAGMGFGPMNQEMLAPVR